MMLEYASYLAIDQSGGNGEEKLNFLKSKKARHLPKLAEFDLTGIFYGNHRNYTHRGWDYAYPVPKDESQDKANWPARKNILRSTVNKVCDFGDRNQYRRKIQGISRLCKEANGDPCQLHPPSTQK